MIKRAREGMRVRHIGHAFMTDVPNDALGTVTKVATIGGKSVYCDPGRHMVFVKWDTGGSVGVFKRELERV